MASRPLSERSREPAELAGGTREGQTSPSLRSERADELRRDQRDEGLDPWGYQEETYDDYFQGFGTDDAAE